MRAEQALTRAVLTFLSLVPGVVAWRQNSGKIQDRRGYWVHLAPTGTPDICGYLPGGRALFIEIKREGERKSQRSQTRREACARQTEFLQRAASAGCLAFSADSLEAVAEVIAREVRS